MVLHLKNISLPCEKDMRAVSVDVFTRFKPLLCRLDHDILVGFQTSRLSFLPIIWHTSSRLIFLKHHFNHVILLSLEDPYFFTFPLWPHSTYLIPLPATPFGTCLGIQPSWVQALERDCLGLNAACATGGPHHHKQAKYALAQCCTILI